SGSELGRVVAADKSGSIYFGGEFTGDISAEGLSPKNSVGGNTDFFLVKYGYDCNCAGSTVQSDFTFTVNNPAKSVQFVYTGTLPVDSIVWKFGDGAKVKQAGPNHIYTAQGTYTVCAIAYMPCGRHMMCKEVTLVCPTPAANYTDTVTAATKTVNVTYTGSTPVD